MRIELNAKEALEVLMEAQRIAKRHGLSMLQAQIVLLVGSGRAASANRIATELGRDRHAIQKSLQKIEDFVARDNWGALALTTAGQELVDKLRRTCFHLCREEDLWGRS